MPKRTRVLSEENGGLLTVDSEVDPIEAETETYYLKASWCVH